MSTIRVLLVSASLLLVAAAEEKPGEENLLRIAAAGAPLLDGKIGEQEWASGAPFSAARGDDLYGEGRVLRSGRDLFLCWRSELPPFALGVRMVFSDPDSAARIVVLVSPLQPPKSPLAVFREFGGADSKRRPAEGCDIRFSFGADDRFSFEARLPLDLLEIGRPAKDYGFAFQVWDLGDNRAIAVYPLTATESMLRPRPAVLRPEKHWGAGEPEPVREPNGALELLDALSRTDDPEAPSIARHDGTSDGQRREAPLREVAKRLEELLPRYPDYASLYAQLLHARIALNEMEGGLELIRALRAGFPPLEVNVRQNLVEGQFLRDLGRYEEGLRFFEGHRPLIERVDEARSLHASLRSLDAAWKAEESIRAEEAKRDDLPRVEFQTIKGKIVIELYEDDAPNVVAHFLSLVESGFYDATKFHWCEGSARVAGGDPNSRDEDPYNDGFGGPEKCVEPQPGRRLGFPFTVAMLDRRRQRRTEGSIFVINLSPAIASDGYSTVLGRVVDGQEAVKRLEYNDLLVKARVLRKRDHPYTPVYR